MEKLRRLSHLMSTCGEVIGVLGILVMVAVSCLDVLGAKLFNRPVPGSIEIISLAQMTTIIFAVAITQRSRGHISVAMFVVRLPSRVQSMIRAFTSLLCTFLFGLIVYESVCIGNEYREAGAVTATVLIPFYPFAYGIGLALTPVLIMFFCDLLDALQEVFAQ